MKPYKDPSFQDRMATAAQAKQKALERLKAKPPVDEAEAARKREARLAREAADAEKRAAKKAAAEQEAADKAARDAEALAAKQAASRPEPTEAERKAARDARYAARKKRK